MTKKDKTFSEREMLDLPVERLEEVVVKLREELRIADKKGGKNDHGINHEIRE